MYYSLVNLSPLSQKFVVRKFASHGMRPLAHAIRRRNDDFVQQRPILPDDTDLKEIERRDEEKYHDHFPGHKKFFASGEALFTEGTFVTWDVDFPEMYKANVKKTLDEHNDILRYTVLRRS